MSRDSSFRKAATHAAAQTDEALASEEAALELPTWDQIRRRLPEPSDQEALDEMIAAVSTETDENRREAALVQNIDRWAGVVVKILGKFPPTALLIAACLALSLLSATALAQTAPTEVSRSIPRVVEVVSDVPGRPHHAGLGDRLTVTVQNLPRLLEEAGGCQGIVLFLGGLPIPESTPERCDPDTGHVGFLLDRPSKTDRAWSALLGSPTHFDRPVRVTVGSSTDRSYPTLIEPGRETFYLITVNPRELVIFVLIVLASGLSLIWLVRHTGMLRSPGPQPLAERPYSLGRFQLAFWSLLVAASFLFVWQVSSNLDTITESVLVLMGMGSATAISSSMLDANDSPTANRPSRGFLEDLLSDSSGVCIQRFQMLVWTLILGVILVATVYKTLDMPDFSPTLLALMGISSGTYLAFKFPEAKRGAAELSSPLTDE